MRLNIKCLLLFIPIVFFTPKTFGQDETQRIALKQVLDSIAAQHHVKFNYTEKDVFGHNIYPPKTAQPLRSKLVYIGNRTGLSYKENGDYIILYKNSTAEKKKFCAYITDEFNTIIQNASVQISDTKSIVAGVDGYFELNTELPEIIYVGHLGYQPVGIAVTEYTGDCINIKLSLAPLELEELVTERYLTSGISKKKDGSFSITPKKFGILPGLIEPDVLLAMQQLPGITSIDQTVSNINVRGGSHDQNLFMWNGIRLFQTGHFFGLISAINPNIAYNIKIAKNGTSAFYGESVSSVVDISSQKSQIENGTTSIGTNMINADFYTKLKVSESANLEISARRSFTDVLDFPTYTEYSERIFQNTVVTELANSTDVNYKSDKEFYFYDFTGQYHQKFGEKHNAYLHVIGINNNLDFTQGTLNATNLITTVSSLDQQTLGGSAGLATQWTDTHSTNFSVYGTLYEVDGTDESLETEERVRQENKIQGYGFKFSNTNRLTDMYKLHSGYQFDQLKVENTDAVDSEIQTRETNQVLRTHAFIGEIEYDPETEDIYVRTGLRFNYIEQLRAIYIEPRLQFNYHIDDAWQMEILAELKSQTTSQVVELQADFLGLENRRWILANDMDVPVQNSSQVSVGVAYKEKGWLISVDNFYKRVNGITTYGQAFQDQLEQVDARGSYRVFGTEFLIQKQYKNFYAWLSYTWNKNDYKFDDIEPSRFSSNFEISHNINSAAIYEWKNFKIALGSRWFTGRPATEPLLNIPVYDNEGTPSVLYEFPNSSNLDDFFQVDFSASYRWDINSKVRMQFGLSVLNIFNRSNIINRYYRINANEDIEVVNTFALNRTPNALVKISF
ncbi:TonB-dependent receptor plug domain-containing protein [Flavobacterium litorale]|uniref:TonB-dependent receptor plug domain-containing protein n=1 Tax=Flavobacterium litorale TaxID=2856519 RepID=A0ABX8V958_9FLAO|nr:TonB-dependent receptor [Flavobacterium litorale]QYJ67360.1 TonB-dependent receptor plug domain-containing protein [Flavobacterium litorale]